MVFLTDAQFNQLKKNPKQKEQGNQPNYFQRVGQDYSNIVNKNIIGGINDAANQAIKSSQQPGVGGLLGTMSGFGRGALRTVGGVAEAAFVPIIEAPGIKQGLEFIGNKVADIPGADSVIKELSLFAEKNPQLSQDAQDIINIITLGGGKVVEKPIQQVAQKTALKTGEAITGTASKAAPTLRGTAEALYNVSVKAEESTLKALQAYDATQSSIWGRVRNFFTGTKNDLTKSFDKPITEANTAIRQGLVGTEWQLGVQAKNASQNLWSKVVEPALKGYPEKLSMKQFLSDIEDQIMKIADLNRRNTLLDAFAKFTDDYKNVSSISLEKLQAYKEGWAKFIPESTYKGKAIGGSLNEIRNLASQYARHTIYTRLGEGVKQAYIDYGNLQSIMKSGIKSIDPLRSKGAFKQAWELVIDKGVTPIATIGGQILYRTADGLEFISDKVIKKVSDIFK